MQQNDDAHWNHKWSALALALLLTLFLAYGQYRGGLGATPAAPPAAPLIRAPAPAKIKKVVRALKAPANETAALATNTSTRGERLREPGEAFGGGKEQREETDAENAGK